MESKSFAIICLRLIAIYLAIQVINLLPTWVSTLSIAFSSNNDDSIKLITLSLLLLILSLTLPLVIWIAAKPISAWVVTKDIQEKTATLLEKNQLFTAQLVFSAVGILILIMSLPEMIVWFSQTITAIAKSNYIYQAPRPSIWLMVTELIKVFLSLSLIFSTKKLANIFQKVVS